MRPRPMSDDPSPPTCRAARICASSPSRVRMISDSRPSCPSIMLIMSMSMLGGAGAATGAAGGAGCGGKAGDGGGCGLASSCCCAFASCVSRSLTRALRAFSPNCALLSCDLCWSASARVAVSLACKLWRHGVDQVGPTAGACGVACHFRKAFRPHRQSAALFPEPSRQTCFAK